jgi:hypothetical protein
VELVPEAGAQAESAGDPASGLLLIEPEASAPEPGSAVGVAVQGGWVIPE